MSEAIHKWLLDGETGLSSKCMAAVALGQSGLDRGGYINHPHDPADLNRCIKLTQAAPEVFHHFPKIAALSPEWNAVIDNWNALVEMFHEEAGENWSKQRSARKTYDHMQALLARSDEQS